MRHDPLYMIWSINCPSADAARAVRDWLIGATGPDATWVDEVRSGPEGGDLIRRETHRFGDFFEGVRVLPAAGPSPASFRLLFQRRTDAGRFWKDGMARVLQGARGAAPGTTATLDYRGDEEPETLAAG